VRRAAVLAGLVLAVAAGTTTAAGGSGGTAVGVGEREWRVSLYRTRVPAGLVRFNVRNYGEDTHDLAVRSRSGKLLGVSPEVRAGRTATLRVRLRRAGRYTVFCTLEGHEANGMRARLVVKRRKR
jgi:plastocyanin